MADVFFFTDLDLLDTHDAGKGQTSSDAFGSQGPSAFRLNSRHKSNKPTGAPPKAYAVMKGHVLIHVEANSPHLNLILKPLNQSASKSRIGIPRIKYFVYRGIQKESVIATGSNPPAFVAKGTIDMIDKIRDTYSASPAETLLDKFLTPLPDADAIDAAFSSASLPSINAGRSIGKFDLNGFAFEIVLDDLDLVDPFLGSRDAGAGSLYSPPSSYATEADKFETRTKREHVLHFLDPCAFYANLYFTGLTAKNSDNSTIAVNGKNRTKRNVIFDVLKKFHNVDKAYVDIRNEDNHSYNYYASVNDPARKDLFSIYSDDLDVGYRNSAGDQAPVPTNYYGITDQWPLLTITNDCFIQTNNKDKNVVSIALPKGNSDSATLFVSNGIRDEGLIGDELTAKAGHAGSFIDLTLAGTHYDSIDLVIPNNHTAAATMIVPTYTRLKYLRRVAVATKSKVPLDSERQYADAIFTPLVLKEKLATPAKVSVSVYENEQYVDLTQADQVAQCEYIGNTGIAVDVRNVTLFCYPVFVNGATRRRRKPAQGTAATDRAEDFIATFGSAGDKNSPVAVNTLSLSPFQPRIVHYQGSGGLFSSWRNDERGRCLAMLIDKNNFKSAVLKKLSDPAFSPGFDIRLALTGQSHRDVDPVNDLDKSSPSRPYSRSLLVLRGFKLDSGNVKVVEIDTGIRMYSDKRDDFDIYPILTDSETVVSSTAAALLPFNSGFLVADPGVFSGAMAPSLPPTSTMDDEHFKSAFASLSDALNNVYNDDLIKFIGLLYAAAVKGDTPSRRLYEYVFSKFIVTKSTKNGAGLFPPVFDAKTKVQLLFADGHLCYRGAPMHQGLLLEGANYFAIWKTAENLKIVADLFSDFFFPAQSPSNEAKNRARFRDRYTFIVSQYPFLNNLVESLRSEGIRSPLDIMNEERFIYAHGLRTDFSLMFRQDRSATGLIDRLAMYYANHDKSRGPRLTYEMADRALTSLNQSKQSYISELSRTIYKGLGGTLSDFTFLNVALGDGSETQGLFGSTGSGGQTAGDGVFLFNYSFERSAPGETRVIATKEVLPLNSLPINQSNDDPYVVHFGIFGIDGNANIEHTVTIERKGTAVSGVDPITGKVHDRFVLGPEKDPKQQRSFAADVATLEDVGKWLNLTKEIALEKPKTHGFTSLSLNLNSKTDEEAFSIILYKSLGSIVLQYAKSFEDFFHDDYFQLTPDKVDQLWTASETESLTTLLSILKTSVTLKAQGMLGGGVGKRKKIESFDAFAGKRHLPGEIVARDGRLYRCAQRVSADRPFDPSQWVLESMVETDSDYVFHSVSNVKWERKTEEKHTDDIAYSLLRYSYASIEYDVNSNELTFSVQSYASPLVSTLNVPKDIVTNGVPTGLKTGLDTNQWLCLPDSTIFRQKPSSEAVLKDEQGNFLYDSNGHKRDSYNQLLSALRTCGLLDAILNRIMVEALDDETLPAQEFTRISTNITNFRDSPDVKVQLTPEDTLTGVHKTELTLKQFRKIVTKTCP